MSGFVGIFRMPQSATYKHAGEGIAVVRQCSQPPERGPEPSPGISYPGQREVLLEFVILVF